MKPLAVDLCCGLGGWTLGLLAEGWDVVGFDVERHSYGNDRYPAQLVLQDIRTIDGRQFKGKVSLITASPPCTEFSYIAMPWSRGKQIGRALRGKDVFPENYKGSRTVKEMTVLFDACIRIGHEAECPIVIENVKGAQPWVGRAKWMYGSFALWGDVPALMPYSFNPDGRKMGDSPGKCWSDRPTGNVAAHREGTKNGGDWFGKGGDYSPMRHMASKSNARKAASAQIARIPFALAQWIAWAWKP